MIIFQKELYVYKTEYRIIFRIKIVYYLEPFTPETTKIYENTKSKITKDKNGENIPRLEITKVVLVHCNIVNKDYQQNSRVFYTFVLSKLIVQLLDILPENFIFLKSFNSEFSCIKVWFTARND